MEVVYEWCYETIDEFGDVVENDFEDKLSSFTESRKTDTLCLVRNEGDEINGLEYRLEAYVEDGKLPKYFNNSSHLVPKRFHKELNQYLTKT